MLHKAQPSGLRRASFPKTASLAVLVGLVVVLSACAQVSVVRVMINGSEISTSEPAAIYNGRVLVPMQLLEATGAKVEWDDSTKTVLVHTAYTFGNWDDPDRDTALCPFARGLRTHWADTLASSDPVVASDIFVLNHFPADDELRPTAEALARFGVVVSEVRRLLRDAMTDPSAIASGKLWAAVALSVVAADMYNRLMSEYADQHDGKDVCGDTFEPLPVDWSQVH